MAPVEIANYPFTTIAANKGVGYVRSKCPCQELGVQCTPHNSGCVDGTRMIPVELLDVAGLVPDAWQGKGLGNQFLDDLRQADALINVIDVSGSTNIEGVPGKPGEHDPREDVEFLRREIEMWIKIIIACIPAIIVGLLFDDALNALFYGPVCVAVMLIVVGAAFILVENLRYGKKPAIRSIRRLDYGRAAVIGLFQMIAAIFPGTSRSGATIIGALLLGVSRRVGVEFTFYLAIPVMFGASLLKIVKYSGTLAAQEVAILITGMLVAFAVSMLVIRKLLNYIKTHDFKAIGWYRIALGALVLVYFLLIKRSV